jgi:sialidase-1
MDFQCIKARMILRFAIASLLATPSLIWAADVPLGRLSRISKGADGCPWRVETLTFDNAGQGAIQDYACLFTIPNYWPYGHFSSQTRCELPGKLFRARASGAPGDQHHFLSPAFWNAVNQYQMVDGRLYLAWRVKTPPQRVEGGRFSYVSPSDGPWKVWCNLGQANEVIWTIELLRDGKPIEEHLRVDPPRDGWFDVQLALDPRAVTLEVNRRSHEALAHDAYSRPFYVQIGSGQSKPGGAEVVSEYREVFLHTIPYPYPGVQFNEGPEDIRPEDKAVVGFYQQATPRHPRVSEGDVVATKEGHLMAVYSDYYAGEGWDGSPARLVAKISKDGGRTWGKSRIVADRDKGSENNVMSASLLWAANGDLLLVYHDRTPEMDSKSMVLRRSADGGTTWGERVPVTPAVSNNRHTANNACLTRLADGRIVLATREYARDARWPYACYSDDDGRTWKAGRHVPDPGLTPVQRQGQNVNEPSICELADRRLLMTMRSIAGGQFFSWSSDGGESWTKPVLSPLRGTCSPAIVRRMPGTGDVLAVWTPGYGGRMPLLSAVSSDGGRT